MRILVVCTDAEIGGAERFLASWGRSRPRHDTVHLVVLMGPGSLSEQLENSFDAVHYLGFPPSSRNLLGMVRSLEGEIQRFQPDVISSHLFHADLVVALARTSIPKISTVHTQKLSTDDHWLTRAIARAVGILSRRFAAVVPASDSSDMARFLADLRMQHVVDPIPNGAQVPSTAAFDASARTFVSIARNHPVKGHRVLFSAFAKIADEAPEWTLEAFGPGVTPEDDAMLAALSDAGALHLVEAGRIRLSGPTANPEAVLSRSAALIISSVYGEAFPIVGAEAAGLGIPVISSDLGSCSEFCDDPQFLVPPNDVPALAAAMRRFVALSEDERSDLSRRARARAEARYHPDVAYARYRQVFERLLASGDGGSQ